MNHIDELADRIVSNLLQKRTKVTLGTVEDYLKDQAEIFQSDRDNDYEAKRDWVKAKLEELLCRERMEWISLEDDKPYMLNGTYPKVLLFNGEIHIGWMEEIDYADRFWTGDGDHLDILPRVTHWRPLPSPASA